MHRPTSYHTRQGEAILAYLASLEGGHVTVEQIAAHLDGQGAGVGVTTIYRHLDKLAADGRVRRYTLDGAAGSCYQYVDDWTPCREHFHLKCEACGGLYHLRCDTLGELADHVAQEHGFQIDPMKTTFYGLCRNCRARDGEAAT
ncbi:MAG: transcriptional repressor [Oscillospiraceae bacterium]|jgi:Fur family ferric uptake transcriptional regulator|nr:transcriptional repressor [Oscillospiraceae bacterium]